MPLTEAQESTLSFLVIAGWSTALGVAKWRGCSVAVATHTLDALLRRGLVVHSDTSDHWSAKPRAKKMLAGLDQHHAKKVDAPAKGE